MTQRIQENSDGTLTLSFDKTLYDSEAVLNTAHRFSDQCYINLDVRDTGLMVSFKPKEQGSVIPMRIVDEFCNELIDQQVRIIVNKRCGNIRDQIVKKAFSPIE
jgi:His-Xaa-Ser system protein HxsD